MVRTQIYLTDEEKTALQDIANETGVSQSELIRHAIDRFIERQQEKDRKTLFQKARGLWKDREDLPDFRILRNEFDRTNSARS